MKTQGKRLENIHSRIMPQPASHLLWPPESLPSAHPISIPESLREPCDSGIPPAQRVAGKTVSSVCPFH